MSEIFIDGFDKYGPIGYPGTSALIVGEWTIAGENMNIVNPLSSTGYALEIGSSILEKTLPGNFSRLIAGVRFQSNLGGMAGGIAGQISFGDAGNNQVSVSILSSTGWIGIYRYSGGVSTLITSTTNISVKANSIHFLEIDITFGSAGAYFIYLDGILILSGNGITNGGTSNNQANQVGLEGGSGSCIFDDLYVFDSTGVYNNAVLLTNPRIETQLPIGSSQTEFTNNGVYLGNIIVSAPDGGFEDVIHHNSLVLIQHTPVVNMTINTINGVMTSAPIDNWRAVLYSDNAGSPNTLLAQSADTQGTVQSTTSLNLLTPQNLIGGIPYWMGFMYKTNILINTEQLTTVSVTDNNLSGVFGAVSYNSGPPTPAPTMSIAGPTYMFYGLCSNVSVNWVSENRNPPPGDLSSMSSNTPGNEELFNFASVSSPPTTIYTVAVKSHAKLTDTGNRSIDLRMKSVGTTNSGTSNSQILSTSYEWADSFFTTDPNNGNLWTEAALNAATSGIKIVS